MEGNNSYQNNSYQNNGYEGSYGAGIALGFLVGLIGLIICIVLNQPLTKKGAIHGFIARLVIGGIFFIIYLTVIINLVSGWR